MKKPYILLIDDDNSVINLITTKLGDSFNFFVANDISESKRYLKNKHIDAVCLDLLLPDGYGLNYCQKIKKEHSEIKVLILTKKIYVNDRVDSFKYGSDDYLAKPFFPEELEVRLNKLLNITKEEELHIHRYGDIVINYEDLSLTYNRVKVFLSNTEISILEYLLSTDKIRSSKEILRYLETKREKEININAFTVSINRLKEKLKKSLGMELIKTRYGIGYYIGI